MLTLPFVMHTDSLHPPERVEGAVPPLTIPPELWEQLPADQKGLCLDAQRVLDTLELEEQRTLKELATDSELDVERVLFALRTLDTMGLVSVGMDGKDVVVRLIAVPDEHVPITGVDGARRWLFVARPLVAPEIASGALN